MKGRTVLVVDDEPDILFMLRMILELSGFVVSDASNGRQAIDAITAEVPDAVVLDIGLPDMSGWDVLERLRDDGTLRAERVVILSAHVSPDAARRAAEFGCGRFVSKPFRTDEIVGALEAIFSSV
jgi:CheY-like chemotaxis protein